MLDEKFMKFLTENEDKIVYVKVIFSNGEAKKYHTRYWKFIAVDRLVYFIKKDDSERVYINYQHLFVLEVKLRND